MSEKRPVQRCEGMGGGEAPSLECPAKTQGGPLVRFPGRPYVPIIHLLLVTDLMGFLGSLPSACLLRATMSGALGFPKPLTGARAAGRTSASDRRVSAALHGSQDLYSAFGRGKPNDNRMGAAE